MGSTFGISRNLGGFTERCSAACWEPHPRRLPAAPYMCLRKASGAHVHHVGVRHVKWCTGPPPPMCLRKARHCARTPWPSPLVRLLCRPSSSEILKTSRGLALTSDCTVTLSG